MRSQDLRLAVHSLRSNLDLTLSLLAKVADDDGLGSDQRAEAARIRASLAALHEETSAGDEERAARLFDDETALTALETEVNGPLLADNA
jgi:hypothetical protein